MQYHEGKITFINIMWFMEYELDIVINLENIPGFCHQSILTNYLRV